VIAQKNVIELIEKIVVYKFPHKSRQELEAMFNLTDWIKGEIKGKLKTVFLLLRLGLKSEQIAQELELELEIVREFIANQNNISHLN
jgi:predicted transposase YdaD